MYKITLMPMGNGITKVRVHYTTEYRQAYYSYEQMCDYIYECIPDPLADMVINHIETWHGCEFYLFDGGLVF